ncbi:hypothetical protein [Allofrancisella frigidaquae]|uniref:Uncharacterized protein n=1 Tax=Allofrancisella frigidaquae TaxID=1085644 RepID=A0A6M3HSE3_9GAMM|nr:hypothetical protein [Allofrancisella frigidaquae]KEI34735.1 hypothetical protein FRA_48c14100 [Francisella sp. W12-1067]QIV94138.1 hypothetical protein E3E15_01710 [Allofrancisella frigidaquae]
MEIKEIPLSYRSCIKFLQETYPDYRLDYKINWDMVTSKYIICKVELLDNEIIVYINASFFIHQTTDMYDLYNNIEYIASHDKEFEKKLWTMWFECFNYYMYPCLTDLNKYYLDSSLFFSSLDYKKNLLSLIEHQIIQLFPKILVSVDIHYEKATLNKTSLLTKASFIENVRLAIDIEPNLYVCGVITFYLKDQEDDYKNDITLLKEKLIEMSQFSGLKFNNLMCLIDYGPLQCSINSKLQNCYLDGGKYLERII